MIPHKVQQAVPENIMTTAQPQRFQQPPSRSMGPLRAKLESIGSGITSEEHSRFGKLYCMYFSEWTHNFLDTIESFMLYVKGYTTKIERNSMVSKYKLWKQGYFETIWDTLKVLLNYAVKKLQLNINKGYQMRCYVSLQLKVLRICQISRF